MHELGIARNIIDIVCKHANGKPVQRVCIEVGALSAVSPDAIRFCFDVCARGTLVEGAELAIDELPARGKCGDCNSQINLELVDWHCYSCGSKNVSCVGGFELNVKEMEICDV